MVKNFCGSIVVTLLHNIRKELTVTDDILQIILERQLAKLSLQNHFFPYRHSEAKEVIQNQDRSFRNNGPEEERLCDFPIAYKLDSPTLPESVF
uniref:Uncharacterized protein n=1 Tax=Solanum lycopersicum TaxID=4081 RepID=A0A3Q7JAI2_SOLLC